jgi:hypothetical protein
VTGGDSADKARRRCARDRLAAATVAIRGNNGHNPQQQ